MDFLDLEMDPFRYEYEQYCDECELLDMDPVPFDDWMKKFWEEM